VGIVTGASRGLGRGIAVGLGEVGATVVLTGRDEEALGATAEEVQRAGGHPDVQPCDHRDDHAVKAMFDRATRAHGRLDLLVNNATAVGDVAELFAATPFWETPTGRWDDLFDVGLRSHFVAGQLAARLMVGQGRGLVVNVSSAAAAHQVPAILPYGVAKAALDRMTSDMARDLVPHGVTALAVWPPPSSTEGMLASAGDDDDVTQWSLPVVTGRVIAALVADPDVARLAGTSCRIRDLASEYGVSDERYAPAEG